MTGGRRAGGKFLERAGVLVQSNGSQGRRRSGRRKERIGWSDRVRGEAPHVAGLAPEDRELSIVQDPIIVLAPDLRRSPGIPPQLSQTYCCSEVYCSIGKVGWERVEEIRTPVLLRSPAEKAGVYKCASGGSEFQFWKAPGLCIWERTRAAHHEHLAVPIANRSSIVRLSTLASIVLLGVP